jgi:hypothetical protein
MHTSTVIDDSGDLSNPDRCTRRLYETAGRVALGLADKLLRDLDPETLIAAAMLRPLEEREAAALLRHLLASENQLDSFRAYRRAELEFEGVVLPDALPVDATTAALERAGEALKPLVTGQHKCGGTWTEKDGRATCAKCSSSWLVPRRVRPESPWVPDNTSEAVPAAPGRSIEARMREVFMEGSALPIPSHPALVAAVLDLMLTMRDHARTGDGFVTLRLSEVLP